MDYKLLKSGEIRCLLYLSATEEITAEHFALLLEEKLAQAGFSAFLDHKSMHRGRFDEEISQTIDEASDFVVVLSKDCFSVHEGTDFFVTEIEYALKKKKNIVPIFLNSYSTQQSIPDSIYDVLKYQGVSEHAPQDFESVFCRN